MTTKNQKQKAEGLPQAERDTGNGQRQRAVLGQGKDLSGATGKTWMSSVLELTEV